ncbi:MAG: hypothetical protein JSV81_17205 [Anaerolineales bacterium]|nr:MAG: hypothetical protein JSV81_17205 [Anaerolineales bacterium]
MTPLVQYDTTTEQFSEIFGKLQETFKEVSPVKPVVYTLAEVFNLVFYAVLWSESSSNASEQHGRLMSRSEWTYHVAFAIRKTAQILSLNYRFETMGRLDAVIETYEENPRVVLMAEWEWDHTSIFGEGKELEKLWQATSSVPDANALLFTYCPGDKIDDFERDVIEYWQGQAAKMGKDHPILYLNTAVYVREESVEFIQAHETCEIHAEGVKIWSPAFLRRAPYA